MTFCIYHCEDRWLPLIPPAEANYDGRDAMDIAGITVPLLFAETYVPCPACSVPLHPDLAAVTNLDVWRCEGVTGI